MGRRHVVRDLSPEQFDFVIKRLMNGDTDREVSSAFATTFKETLAKSSLNRWRKASGDALLEKYQLIRFLANQLRQDLQAEDKDSYALTIEKLEERMLLGMHEIISADPLKLLRIRQDEAWRQLKEREVDLKTQQFELAKEKMRRETSLEQERFAIATDVWKFLLAWFLRNEPKGADLLTKRSNEVLKELATHLENQTV